MSVSAPFRKEESAVSDQIRRYRKIVPRTVSVDPVDSPGVRAPLRGSHPGPGLSGTRLVKVGQMLTILARLEGRLCVEPLRSMLQSVARQEAFDASSILAEVSSLAAECRGERVWEGEELATAFGRVFLNSPDKEK